MASGASDAAAGHPAPGHDPHFDERVTAAREGLVREIGVSGVWNADPGWRAAFAAVPRHLFVPYYYVGTADGYERRWAEDPEPARRAEWLRGAYADAPLATRVRDGALVSSSSQPSLMARMLVGLHVEDGDSVLEIGAGTGYNAALLAYRLGDERVTTIDLDPEITDAARVHLTRAGYHPSVITGDGARGYAEHAPYDRIIATCTLDDVPRAWLAQCRPGARILLPVATGLVALDVSDHTRASGRFLPTPAYFVPLRGTDQPRREPGPQVFHGLPRRALRVDSFRFLLALTDSALDPRDATAIWDEAGHPERERYGVTVDGVRSWAWLDDPDGRYAWPL